jgi:hypothetical protein
VRDRTGRCRTSSGSAYGEKEPHSITGRNGRSVSDVVVGGCLSEHVYSGFWVKVIGQAHAKTRRARRWRRCGHAVQRQRRGCLPRLPQTETTRNSLA